MKKLILFLSIALLSLNLKAQTKIKVEGDTAWVVADSTMKVHGKKGDIGVNTTKKQKTHVNLHSGKKYIDMPESELLLTCGAAFNLVTNAVCCVTLNGASGLYVSCVLYEGWTNTGGQCLAININGSWYKDGNNGYGLWTGSANGIACEAPLIAGGISAGKVFNSFIRTYCNADTTGSPFFDTPVKIYAVPSDFVCASSAVLTPVPTKKRH